MVKLFIPTRQQDPDQLTIVRQITCPQPIWDVNISLPYILIWVAAHILFRLALLALTLCHLELDLDALSDHPPSFGWCSHSVLWVDIFLFCIAVFSKCQRQASWPCDCYFGLHGHQHSLMQTKINHLCSVSWRLDKGGIIADSDSLLKGFRTRYLQSHGGLMYLSL